MYAALWRSLPGPAPVKALCCVVLLVLAAAVCVQWVFPWVASLLALDQADVGAARTLRETVLGPGRPCNPWSTA